MNIELAYELLEELRTNAQFLCTENKEIVRYVQYKNYGLGVTSSDTITLINIEKAKPIFSIKINDSEYNLADMICLAYHQKDGKDIFHYL
jgi:hypothetical protein